MAELHPDTLLPRKQAAAALTDAGYPIAAGTLDTKASRGNGPPYRRFGKRALYRWGDLLAWAESCLTPPCRSAAQARAQFPAASITAISHTETAAVQ